MNSISQEICTVKFNETKEKNAIDNFLESGNIIYNDILIALQDTKIEQIGIAEISTLTKYLELLLDSIQTIKSCGYKLQQAFPLSNNF